MSRGREGSRGRAAASPGPRRAVLLTAFAVAALLVLGRALQLQAVDHERWETIAEGQNQERVSLPPRRGAIYDRNGVPLALSHETFRVSVAPRELVDPRATAAALVRVLGVSERDARRATDRGRRWVVLAGRYSAAQRRELRGARGVYFERTLERFYPQDPVGMEVLGRVARDGEALGGVEQQFEAVLRGEPGYSVLRRDARGRVHPSLSLPVVPPRDGADVYLTLDLNLQEIADGALRQAVRSTGATGGDLLIVDPKTGEVLAAVSQRSGAASGTLSALTEPFEPGSTLKPFVVAALLAEGTASLEDGVDAENGVWRAAGGRTIRDVQRHEWLTLRDALRFSSNIALVKFAEELPRGELYRYLRDFGFGTPTGVDFPSEAAGRLRHPARWSALTPASLSMGYEISVTPLQMVMAYAALANGGVLMEPRLVREVRLRDGTTHAFPPAVLRRVVPEEVAGVVSEVLAAVVEDGTATRASLSTFSVAGKTGTARRVSAGGRYEAGSYTASFAGFFPAADPQLALFIKLDRPQGDYYGGLTAAPVTRETLQAALAAHTPAVDGRSLLGTRLAARERPGAAPPRPPPAWTGEDGPFVFLLEEGIPRLRPRDSTPPVPVPVLEGLPLRDAARRTHALGLQVRLRGTGRVARTVPAAGTPLVPGDTLLLMGADS